MQMTSRRYLLLLSYMGLGFSGLTFTTTSTLWPAIIDDLDLRLSEAGLLLSAISAGFLASILLSNYLVTVLRRKQILLSGIGLMMLGVTTFGLDSSVTVNIFSALCIGAGQGFTEIPINAINLNLHPEENRGSGLSFLHMFFGVGGLIGPQYASALFSWTASWRTAFLINGALFGILFILFALQRLPAPPKSKKTTEPLKKPVGKFQPWRQPALLLLVLAASMGVGGEVGVGRWLTTYFDFAYASSVEVAANGLFLGWIGLTLGRFLLSRVTTRIQNRNEIILQIMIIIGVVILIFLLTAPNQTWANLWYFLFGLSMSGTIPLLLALGGTVDPHHPDEVTSLLYIALGAGSTLSPWMVSLIAEASNIRIGLFFSVFLLVGMVSVIQMIRRRGQKT